jgi:phosphoribosylglycinamide formyltransferase-1
MKARIGVLASGGGSNLEAILAYLDRLGDRRAGDVVLVASDRPTAGALTRARARHIEAVELAEPRGLDDALAAREIDFVVLAGYRRLVPPVVVRRYAGRIVNVHPALLPAFGGAGMYGRRVHQAVLASGAKLSGVTVHFVDEEYDHGTIIAQWPVPVLVGDDVHSLAARVLRVEHLLFPRVVDAVAGGRLTPAACGPSHALTADASAAFTLLPREDSCLAEEIDRALAC